MVPSEVLNDYAGAQFGDERLERRLVRIAGAVSVESERSFPKLLSESKLEAAYRFLNNDKVEPDELLHDPGGSRDAHSASEHRFVGLGGGCV